MSFSLSIALALGILCLAAPVGAQGTREEPRIALVIGNSAYPEVPLRNPVNDVHAMAKMNVVILDACRNNPFERRLRGASRGLAAVDAAQGTLIAYATAPGSVAADGEGANGLYTEELLQALRVPGLKIEEVFKRVRVGVTNQSKGAQTPWESSSLTDDLVVNVTVNVTSVQSDLRQAVIRSISFASPPDDDAHPDQYGHDPGHVPRRDGKQAMAHGRGGA